MTRQGWVEKLIQQKVRKTGAGVSYVSASELLRQEHARAVRVVKQVGKQDILKRFDHKTYEYAEGYLAACLDILAALQRGRE